MLNTFLTQSSISTDAIFRNVGLKFSTAIQAVGMVKTADTGQIDWSTVNRPATNAYGGYEIYRFNDALQSSYPVFFKIRYGQGSTANTLSIEIQIGTGSNGSGTLTGNTTDVFVARNGFVDATNSFMSFVSGSDDRMQLGFCVGAPSSYTLGISISRTRDASGNGTSYGVNYYHVSASGHAQQLLSFSLGKYPTTAFTTLIAVAPPSTQTSIYNGEQGVYPVTPLKGYADFPDLGMVIYNATEVGAGQVFGIYLLGATRKFITMGTWGSAPHANGQSNSCGAAVRFD